MTEHSFENLVPNPLQGRFDGSQGNYTPEDAVKLRGSINIGYTLAEMGANRLWELLHSEDYKLFVI